MAESNALLAASLIAAVGVGAFGAAFMDKPAAIAEEKKEVWNITAFHENLTSFQGGLDNLSAAMTGFQQSAQEEAQRQKDIIGQLDQLAKESSKNKNLTDATYEKMIVDRLGKAVYTRDGKNSKIQIFTLAEEDMRGYMAKIKLKTDKALRVTVNPSDSPKGETTAQAVKRTGAIFGVNGGGFASSTQDGVTKLVPLGNAMVEGKLVGDFTPSWNDLAFAGFTKSGKLVGGIYNTEEELKKSGAWQGVSFVPVLIRDWEKITIPSKWAKSKQPRTVLGQYPNGDVFFIVVDGRQKDWSTGITLEEMQVLLLRLGVMEAFTLDGGGSSAMVYNGKLLNKPSDGNQRKVATNIVVMP